MKSEYLSGVTIKPSSYVGLFIIGSGHDTWYAGSYSTVTANSGVKEEIVEMANRLNFTNKAKRDWEWHHVVETQHISQITSHDLFQVEFYHMPTILISKIEHTYLSRNFNNNEFRELTNTTPGRLPAGPQMSDKDKLKARIRNLQHMYEHAYSDYPNLKRIAQNVFKYYNNMI